MCDRMRGLVKEVYGMDVDNLEEIEQVQERGQKILETLRYSKTSVQSDDSASNTASDDATQSDGEEWKP